MLWDVLECFACFLMLLILRHFRFFKDVFGHFWTFSYVLSCFMLFWDILERFGRFLDAFGHLLLSSFLLFYFYFSTFYISTFLLFFTFFSFVLFLLLFTSPNPAIPQSQNPKIPKSQSAYSLLNGILGATNRHTNRPTIYGNTHANRKTDTLLRCPKGRVKWEKKSKLPTFHNQKKKSCIRETLNLSTNANSSTDTIFFFGSLSFFLKGV